ncbi:MAG: hypothetical protein A2275_03475 [Bacteroidetes bacterium RIFOXYA12_FULL_35_11]|nr:MAG: hypothetical protein A2X01_05565 [Bacteroidetes bacterium GWF2_35_48]OFY81931.1 MAG: hypothetical protein A2275_03475 [Bacteroidetes bacterium RIFOXYA12_FULL_35_11]OFY96273.1 MAG: hypothetical protein A2309_12915 [Bacteroidetes bacterium RIFOXYB2_FULL_35_7]OFZ05907.1 MAG: hypothetical protein A2491_16420 [Bacteroidetes bacterium RIFOXYC12_FULL_35_7]HBX52223.1 hypothetical protein [Bacteroidales bacterium]
MRFIFVNILLFFCFSFIKAQPPINDEPCGAILLENNISNHYLHYNVVASTYSNVPNLCNANTGKDIWYKVVVPDTGTIILSGTIPVYFYRGNSCDSLYNIGCNIHSFSASDSLPNNQIWLRVWNNISDMFTISIAYYYPEPEDTSNILNDTTNILNIAPATNYESLVAAFTQYGVTIDSVRYTGDSMGIGTFSNAGNAQIGMNEGIIISTGSIMNANGPNNNGSVSGTLTGPESDTNLANSINTSPSNLYDASVLEFNVIPSGNVLEFNYTFGSEEYPEFANSNYNDVFGFFITGSDPAGGNYIGKNIALLPGTYLPVSINNVNDVINSQFYYENSNDLYIQYDGLTIFLTATVAVIPSAVYHLKIAIADCYDSSFDSGVFLQTPSLKSYTISSSENKNNEDAFIKIFPMPVTHESVLEFNFQKTENIKIEILDILGKKIKEITPLNKEKGTQSIPLNFIHEKGIYVLNVKTETQSFSEKFIVE